VPELSRKNGGQHGRGHQLDVAEQRRSRGRCHRQLRREQGLNVISDIEHHDACAAPLGVLPDCGRPAQSLG